jgi:hypothetical protein
MTNRIDLDPGKFPLPAAPRAARGPSSGVRKAFLQAASPNPVPCPGNPSRDQIARVGSGERPRRRNLCCRRILCNQSSGFCLDSQVAIQSRLEFWVESQKRRRSISQRIDQFLADPCTGSTGARKPFGGSVSHSRSGSGPRAAASDLPIPTHFSGFKLLSTDELVPQLPWHFTV